MSTNHARPTLTEWQRRAPACQPTPSRTWRHDRVDSEEASGIRLAGGVWLASAWLTTSWNSAEELTGWQRIDAAWRCAGRGEQYVITRCHSSKILSCSLNQLSRTHKYRLTEDSSNSLLFTARSVSERGIAKASCLSVYPSVRLSVCVAEVSWS